jgi:hypothetical protein
VQGVDATHFDPYGQVTRAQVNPYAPATRGEMAQMLYDLMGLRGPLVTG